MVKLYVTSDRQVTKRIILFLDLENRKSGSMMRYTTFIMEVKSMPSRWKAKVTEPRDLWAKSYRRCSLLRVQN